MKIIIIFLGLITLFNMVETKGVMGKMIGKNRWAGAKYSTGWGHFLRKHAKKGQLTKASVKGLLGTGLMPGSLIALDKINSAKQENDKDLGWIRELMKADESGLRY